MISIVWLAIIMIAEGVLGEAVCYWRRASWRSREVIAATVAEDEARKLAADEQDILAGLARRPYPPWVFTDGRRIADDLRRTFPDLADGELARVAIHVRLIAGNEHANGRNVVQISHLFGGAALELAHIDVTRHGRVTK